MLILNRYKRKIISKKVTWILVDRQHQHQHQKQETVYHIITDKSIFLL
jgi:hypothetical protein